MIFDQTSVVLLDPSSSGLSPCPNRPKTSHVQLSSQKYVYALMQQRALIQTAPAPRTWKLSDYHRSVQYITASEWPSCTPCSHTREHTLTRNTTRKKASRNKNEKAAAGTVDAAAAAAAAVATFCVWP